MRLTQAIAEGAAGSHIGVPHSGCEKEGTASCAIPSFAMKLRSQQAGCAS
jgi:hypothetical protein